MRLDKRKIAFSVIGVCLVLFLASGIRAQGSLQIANPASGTTLNPGQTVVVDVTASGGTVNGVMIVAPEANVDTVLSSPPYEFSFTLPLQVTPGLTTIGALGLTASGPVTAEIQVDIERSDSPQTMTTDTSQLELAVGDSVPVQVFGTYADGTILRLTNSTQTTYLSQAPSVAGVSPYGIVTAAAPGSTQIVVDGMVFVSVTVDPPIAVLPALATLVASQTRNFIAPTSALASTAVTWSLNPGFGTVDANGVYTAPVAVPSQETDVLTATSVANNALTASATITFCPPPP
ncbi:MAG: Ig-like domain-containing protein [Bryobacteraceae bacterium]